MGWGTGVRWWQALAVAVLVAAFGSLAPAAASAGVGELDPTFGSGGVVLSGFGPAAFPESQGAGLAVAQNGDIYQTGEATDSADRPEFFLARFLPNGTPDSSFGVGGVATEQLGQGATPSSEAFDVRILPSGDVLVFGDAGGNVALAEFTPGGALDTRFAPSSPIPGVYFENPAIPSEQGVAEAGLAVQSDGKPVLTINVPLGTSHSTLTANAALVQRLNTNGTPDTSFGSGGTYTVPPGTASFAQVEVGRAIVDSTGHIVFVLSPWTASGKVPVGAAMTLDSLSAAGAPNPGFPASVQASTDTAGAESVAIAVMQAANGDYVAAGSASAGNPTTGGGSQRALVAIKPGGAPDTGFGANGTGTVAFGPIGLLELTDIVQQTDGRFVVVGFGAGFTGQTVSAARLLPTGTPDSSFGFGGVVAPHLPYSLFAPYDALSADGQLLVSAQETAATTTEAFLGKLTLDAPPSLALTSAPSAPVVGQPVSFVAASIDASSTPTVAWDLGSGAFTDATGLTATKTFSSPGTYTIRARATDDEGESTVAQQTVTVVPAPAPPGPNTVTVPAPLPASECTSSLTPTTAITSKLLLPEGLLLTGSSAAHCPSTVTSVGVAIARSKRKRCSFLSSRGRWGKYGSCVPTSYLPASGTYGWAFALKRRFSTGTYWVWEHALDNAGVATRNTAAKHVTFKVKG